MSLAKMTSKGQITIPKQIREHLNLHVGDSVEFVIDVKGLIIMKPKNLDVENLFDMIKTDKKMSIEDMDKAINESNLFWSE